METLESLSEALGTTKDIQSIVRTMKSLSAVSIRQYERAEEALAGYSRTIDLGLSAVLGQGRSLGTAFPAPGRDGTGRDALIVIGSDRGLCGRYNDVVSRRAIEDLGAAEAVLGIIGVRAAARIEAAGHVADTLFTVPGSVDGFTGIVQSVIITIDRWTAEQDVSRVRVVHNRRVGQNTAQPVVHQLLPIPKDDLERATTTRWPARGLPFFRMDRDVLLSWLIRERLFVLLYRALAEALASEHATRLAAMQNAERNIKDRRDDLAAAFRQKRQENITRELLDVVAGYEAARPVE
tara:strand:- start:1019 stop:1900 length:882 start_codon:yes stop_codon:yes gene_type:complete